MILKTTLMHPWGSRDMNILDPQVDMHGVLGENISTIVITWDGLCSSLLFIECLLFSCDLLCQLL